MRCSFSPGTGAHTIRIGSPGRKRHGSNARGAGAGAMARSASSSRSSRSRSATSAGVNSADGSSREPLPEIERGVLKKAA
jgi:hypothetical protein